MFVRIRNSPLGYAWGSDGEITRLLGDAGACVPARRGEPEAELWLGAHHGSPSEIVDLEASGGATDVRSWIAADRDVTLGASATDGPDGEGARLPFLMKVLAAAEPLSLQVHPSLDDACAGFAREDAAGLPIDDPARSYRDRSHKPELLIAVSETMETLAGFRRHDESIGVLERFAQAADGAGRAVLERLVDRVRAAGGDAERRDLVAWLLDGGDEACRVTDAIVTVASDAAGDAGAAGAVGLAREVDTVRRIAAHHPGDPGIVIALLLNRVTLARGEAMFVSAGTMHAYVEGVGIEVMASSDNVLRGGLTRKHVDVPELLRVLDVRETDPTRVAPIDRGDGALEFPVPVDDFRVLRVTRGQNEPSASTTLDLSGPAIALCLDGAASIDGSNGTVDVRRGDAVFITPDEGAIRVSGACDLVVATTGTTEHAPAAGA